MVKQNPYTFADKISSDKTLRSKFLEKFFTALIEDMSPEQRDNRLKRLLIENQVFDISEYGADNFIAEVASQYPNILTDDYDVDITLIAPTL